ncbi:MAG: hypothetical protein EZS28_041370 [Streblomastix strix]|uniref:Uncharacterized protein n=1 Tax=Streblomastix strix TaxID=222440 RepID=A0A5J4TYR6_9EUKA|nr:MAG: hypothetical protein EZS28_041370 [Streblomastix strix]
MIYKHLKQGESVDGVCGIFRYLVIYLLILNLLMLNMLECQLLLLVLLVVLVKNKIWRSEKNWVTSPYFLSNLNKGRNYNPSFPPQPLLVRRSDEQIEEEGGNEEIESQLINKKSDYGHIKNSANYAKGWILNNFIKYDNPKPDWY